MLVSSVFIIPPFKKKFKKNYLFPAPSSTEYAACRFCFVFFFNANIWGDNEKVTLANH